MNSLNDEDWPSFLMVTNFGLFKSLNKKFFIVQGAIENEFSPDGEMVFYGTFFYGITWDKASNIYLGNNTELIQLNGRSRPKGFCHTVGFDDIHQILCVNNLIYVVDTKHDRISIVLCTNHKAAVVKSIHMPKNCHINSIYHKDNKFYVCAHNFKKPSFINVYSKNFNLLETIENVGFQNHNVYIQDDWLYSLSSKTLEIFKYNLKTKERVFMPFDHKSMGINQDRIYLRGLAKSKDYYLIGVSSDEPLREVRHKLDVPAWIVLLDNNFQFVDSMEIYFGNQIKDLRIVDETELCT